MQESDEQENKYEYTDELTDGYISLCYEIEKLSIFMDILEEFIEIDEDCVSDNFLEMAKQKVNGLYKKLEDLNDDVANLLEVEDFLENGPGMKEELDED